MDGVTAVSLFVGIIGTAIAIYQAAVLRESRARRKELQFLLAGINGSALQKQQTWHTQISLSKNPEEQVDLDMIKLMVRARDDFTDIANLTVALEGAIDTGSSAINDMMDKRFETIRKNNLVQEEVLKNPKSNTPSQ